MSRGNPEPWLRKGRGYYVTIDGVQHNLPTADKAEVHKRWHQLMAQREEPRRLDEDPFVGDLLALFCDWAKNQLSTASYVWYRNYLRGLVDKLQQELRFLMSWSGELPTMWLDCELPWTKLFRKAVRLTYTQPHFGGDRCWFLCPKEGCCVEGGRRCNRLYLPPGTRDFGCRQCHGLVYRSSQESRKQTRWSAPGVRIKEQFDRLMAEHLKR